MSFHASFSQDLTFANIENKGEDLAIKRAKMLKGIESSFLVNVDSEFKHLIQNMLCDIVQILSIALLTANGSTSLSVFNFKGTIS